MLSEDSRTVIRRALQCYRGDDLERAERAFRGHDLSELYGQSGETKGAILEGYRRHVQAVERALVEVNEGVPPVQTG